MGVVAVPTIATAIKAGVTLIGAGKVAVLPFLIAAVTYFHYDQFDPENRPVSNVKIEEKKRFLDSRALYTNITYFLNTHNIFYLKIFSYYRLIEIQIQNTTL